MRDDAVLGRALPLDRGLGPISTDGHFCKNARLCCCRETALYGTLYELP